MVVRLSAIALACRPHVLLRLMVGGRRMVIGLGLGRRSLIEVVRVNFLLGVGLH